MAQGGEDPCFAHTLVDGHVVDPDTARDVARFRKGERDRLYNLRKATPLDERKRMAADVAEKLTQELGDVSGKVIATYWPIRGELDLRDWMAAAHTQGAVIVLPVVVKRYEPLEFHQWTPGCEMKLGDWNIPVPANGETITPDIVIAPLLGVDENNYRLGNGGGYYDRTLARLPPRTLKFGVGQGFCKMKTIFPMPWDVAMDRLILAERL